jgi:ribosomal protein S18 acetylase RimI-like enzyme
MSSGGRERVRAFTWELERRCAERLEPTAFGTAFVNLDFPRRHDSNFVWVERPLAGVEADSLAADADRVLGEHGLAHRKLYVEEDEHGRRLAVEFLDLGWSAEHLVWMRRVREPEARPPVPVREVGYAGARPILEETLRREPYGTDEEVVRQLTEFRLVLERAVGARFFVAELDGRAACVCELYVIGGVAQIESVDTLEEFRGRGCASAVVLAAVDAAHRRGADLVFLTADESDWPKDLYRRLGFEPVGRSWSFARVPESRS